MAEGEFDFSSNAQTDDLAVHATLDHHTTMLSGVARIGRVVDATEGDPKFPNDIPRVLVQVGGSSEGSYIRNWMPWTTTRAGYDGEWWAPERDEQVFVIAPSGDLTQGIIVGSLFRGVLTFDSEGADGDGKIKAREPIPNINEDDKNIHKRSYKDGSSVTYDRKQHNLSIEVKSTPESEDETSAIFNAAKSIVLSAGSTRITINQDGAVDISAANNDITISGNVKVTGTMDVS